MNSSFRILTNHDEPINRNLVIVVNKNGQVSTDTDVLQNLLTSKGAANTGISILRETSPTPSISDEIEQERSEKIEMKRQEYLSAHAGEEIDEEELEIQMKQIVTGTMEDDIPHVTLNVENFFSPDQARKFANDVLHLGGIDNPQSLMPIDFNFRRQIIQNDHCYTPLTQSPLQSPERNEKSQSSKANKGAQNKSIKREPKQTVKTRQQQVEEDSSDSGEAAIEEDEEYEEEQTDEGEDISFSESDDDNDIDFSVNDRFGKKGKKKRKYRKHKQKSLTFKDFLESGEIAQADDEPKKKYNKSLKKVLAPKPSTSGKIVTISTPKTTSQPVVIRKSAPAQTFLVKSNIVRKEPLTQFVPLTLGYVKNNTMQLPGQISVQSSKPMKSKQEIEFVESIVKDLEKSFPEDDKKVQPNTIPNIMQMMETNTPAEMIDQSLSSLEQLDSGDGAVPGIDEIGDALIAALGNDAIDELLNQNDLINFDPTQNTPMVKISQPMVSSSIQHTPTNTAVSEASTSSHQASNPMPKILNKQPPAKEPIKLVRNGRVIVLPAIEAPATRGAKRRAQGDSPNTSISSPTVGKVVKTEKAPSNKDPDSRNSSRRSSLNKSESGKSSRRHSLAQGAATVEDEMDDLNSDGSWASEDDPDRLWCICQQPHNNRFMICCDKCEGWFHGKCVNVTKAMGKEFEVMGKEWRCPNCKAEGSANSELKKPSANKKPLNQQKLTKFFAKSQKESTDEDIAKTTCVVCKMPARESSIYCSDECIQNHATKYQDDNSQVSKQAVTSPKPEMKRGNVLKDKSGNVIVFDKTTGKILPLSKWPHFTTLRQWLNQNPNYKPVEPGSTQADQLFARNKNQSQSQTLTTTISASATKLQLIKSTSAEDLFSNPVKINTGASPAQIVVAKKTPAQGQHSGLSGSVRSNVSMKNTSSSAGIKTSHASSKSPNATSSNKSSSSKNDKKAKRPVPEERSSVNSNIKTKTENERLNIRNIFKDTLNERMKEFDHPDIPKMSEKDIEKFAEEIEKEMYLFFNKEIREKYKAKYRSLKFNLGDVKNKTLLEKICSKKLTPKQLVALPPAALASEELSKWREDENKHQLEIITKSELDALTQNKIVVKTHKGEEIIETKSAPADILVPVDDVESVIAKTVLSIEDPHGRYDLSRSISLNISGGNVNSPLSSPSISSSTGRKSDGRHRSRSRSKSKSKDHHYHHHHHKSSSSSSKHKKSDRHRSRSPRHHSSRDKDRKSRDRSKSKKSDDHKSHRDSKSKEKDKSLNKSTGNSATKSRDHKKDSNLQLKTEEKNDSLFAIKPDQQDVDLVGKILDSMGVHLPPTQPIAPKMKDEKIKEEVKSDIVQSAWLKDLPQESMESMNKEIEVYSGNINMGGETDVGKIDVTASMVSGNIDDILKLIEPQLEIVGRLDPKAGLDYLDKIKKHPGKELFILRFASNDSVAYAKIFDFLIEKNKFAVIKSKSPNEKVKDFYLIPLESHRPLPQSLLPINGPGFVEGEANKPNLILGAIVKVLDVKLKRSQPPLKKVMKLSRAQGENTIQSMFAKHKSNVNKLTLGLPEFSSTGEMQMSSTKHSPPGENDDGDEPYTPFDDDDESSSYKAATSTSIPGTTEIEMEMKDIDREIKQRQMEIQSMAQKQAMELDEEQASRIFKSIDVPHNLSEILSTISKVQTQEMKPMDIDNDDEDEYVPTPIGCTDYRAAPSYSATQPAPIANSMMDIDERIAHFQSGPVMSSIPVNDQPSRLATMTDADLMKLVPDDAFEAPPAPIISVDKIQPPIPGLDGNDFDMD